MRGLAQGGADDEREHVLAWLRALSATQRKGHHHAAALALDEAIHQISRGMHVPAERKARHLGTCQECSRFLSSVGRCPAGHTGPRLVGGLVLP